VRLGRLIRRGAPTTIGLRSLSCDPGCAVALQLVVGRRVVGVRTATVRGKRARLAVRPVRKHAKRLRRRRAVKAVVRVEVVDAQARRARGQRRLTARR
jgi:hypothetical protein